MSKIVNTRNGYLNCFFCIFWRHYCLLAKSISIAELMNWSNNDMPQDSKYLNKCWNHSFSSKKEHKLKKYFIIILLLNIGGLKGELALATFFTTAGLISKSIFKLTCFKLFVDFVACSLLGLALIVSCFCCCGLNAGGVILNNDIC